MTTKRTQKNIWRASIDADVIGFFPSLSQAKKALSVKAIRAAFGQNGYVDVYDPKKKIWTGDADENGYRSAAHRVTGRDGGWYCNG